MIKAFACLAVLAVLPLAACAVPTPYEASLSRPHSGTTKGYRDAEVAPGRYRVTFAGNWVTPKATVEAFVLYRAAELTVAGGNDYFVVRERKTDLRVIRGAMADFYPSIAGSSSTGAISRTYPGYVYTASATIEVGRGKLPADEPEAYDARAVIERIAPLVQAAAHQRVL